MSKKVIAVLIAFLYSISNAIIGPMVMAQNICRDEISVLSFVITFVVCSAFNIILVTICSKDYSHGLNGKIERKLNALTDTKLTFVVWMFIFAMWIPAFLILYPGVLSYDAISQVGSAINGITSNHHPVLHTWLIRVFMEFGNRFLNSREHGIGLLSLFQMLFLSYSLSRMAMTLKKHNVPSVIVCVTILLSGVWFMNACLSVTMIKDTLFAAFFVLFVCHFCEIVLDPDDYCSKKHNYICMGIVAFFMCAFRNNGLHIYAFCFLLLGLIKIKNIAKIKKYWVLVVTIICPVIIFKIYSGPFLGLLGIEQGEVREALCVPIQQLQRVAVIRENELSIEQRDLMDYYIDNLEWMEPSPGRLYDPFFADPAKSCFYSSHYEENPVQFWKFYLSIGRQFSKEYVAAFLSNTLGYWYSDFYSYSYVMYDNYPSESFAVPLERKSILNTSLLEKCYKSLCLGSFWRDIPGLNLFFVSGYTPWILLLIITLAWKGKQFFTTLFPLFFPLIAQFGILLLSPMSSFRYSWPFYLVLPISFIAVFPIWNTSSEENHTNTI